MAKVEINVEALYLEYLKEIGLSEAEMSESLKDCMITSFYGGVFQIMKAFDTEETHNATDEEMEDATQDVYNQLNNFFLKQSGQAN
jgi:hypothetical protein